MKDELDGKLMIEVAALRPKTYSYLTDDYDEIKKAKSTKQCTIKLKLKFEDYKHCLEATQIKNEMKQLEKINLIQIVFEKIIKNSQKIRN